MRLTINVTAKKAETELHVRQDGYRAGGDWDWYYESAKAAWPMALQQLKTFLEK